MYIADYLHEHEGSVWTPEYTAEVMRIIGEIEKLALALHESRLPERNILNSLPNERILNS